MDSKVCECCQELTGGFPLCLDQFFFEKNDLQRPKMLKKWFLVIFKAHSPLRQKNGIFKRDQTQNHACLTQTNDFIPYTNIYNQIIIWGPYLAISGHCEKVVILLCPRSGLWTTLLLGGSLPGLRCYYCREAS